MDPLDLIQTRHLVSLNTARIKLKKFPKISKDLAELFELLKEYSENKEVKIYKPDGFLDIES